MKSTTSALGLSALAALTAAAGCSSICAHCDLRGHDINTEPRIGPGVQLETVSPETGTAVGDAEANAPSLTSLDRNHWSLSVVAAPWGVVDHQPTYTNPDRIDKTALRQQHRYPTEMSSLHAGGAHGRHHQREEGWIAPVWAAGDVLLMIPRMFTEHPRSTVSIPMETYERMPWRAQPSADFAGMPLGVEPTGEARTATAPPVQAVPAKN